MTERTTAEQLEIDILHVMKLLEDEMVKIRAEIEELQADLSGEKESCTRLWQDARGEKKPCKSEDEQGEDGVEADVFGGDDFHGSPFT